MTARDEMPSEQAIVARLTDAGYRTFTAKSVAKKLHAMSQELQAGFIQWWMTKSYPTDLSIEGFTIEKLMDTGKFSEPESAFIFLDWLRREPRTALEAFRAPMHRVLEDEH